MESDFVCKYNVGGSKERMAKGQMLNETLCKRCHAARKNHWTNYDYHFERTWQNEQVWCQYTDKRRAADCILTNIHDKAPDFCPYVLEHIVLKK